jgi:hypothetical protein
LNVVAVFFGIKTPVNVATVKFQISGRVY